MCNEVNITEVEKQFIIRFIEIEQIYQKCTEAKFLKK